MKSLKLLIVLPLGLLALFIAVGFLLPSYAHIERDLVVASSPETVFAQVNTLKNWEKWSPWLDIDPTMEINQTGPTSGGGATYVWTSQHPGLGNGQLLITDSQRPVLVEVSFNYAHNKTWLTFQMKPEAGGTKVTCRLDVNLGLNPINRYEGLFMDGSMGPDLERALLNLSQLAEKKEVSNR